MSSSVSKVLPSHNSSSIVEAFAVPQDIQTAFYPQKRLTLNEFITFTRKHPFESSSSATSDPHAFFSIKEPNLKAATAVTLQFLRLPPTSLIEEIWRIREDAWKSGKNSIVYAHISSQDLCFPLWTLAFWKAMAALRTNHIDPWINAMTHLNMLNQMHSSHDKKFLIKRVQGLFPLVCWLSPIVGFSGNVGNISNLSSFCSRNWLSDIEISQMLELLDLELRVSTEFKPVHIASPFFLQKLHAIRMESSSNPGVYDAPVNSWIKEIGSKFEKGEKENLATVAFVDGNHWVGVIVEWSTKIVRYGDSLGHNCPSWPGPWIMETIEWWFGMHHAHSSSISLMPLPVSRQSDSFSCGLMAVNSISYYLSPHKFPLLKSDEVDWARLETLIKVFERHMVLAGALPSSDALWGVDLRISDSKMSDEDVTVVNDPSPPTTPRQQKKDIDPDFKLTDSEESTADDGPMQTSQKRDHSSRTPPQSPQKKKRKHNHNKSKPLQKSLKSFFPQNLMQSNKRTDHMQQNQIPHSERVLNLPQSLINTDDEHEWEEVGGTAGAGRPAEEVLHLISRRFTKSINGRAKECVRCLGCRYTWKGPRNRTRVLKHASTCPSLNSDLRRRASIAISNDSFSRKVERQLPLREFDEVEVTELKSKESVAKVKINYFGEQGRKQQKLKIDQAVVNFLCENGIPIRVTRSRSWISLWSTAIPSYRPASETTIQDSQIPAEANYIRLLHIEQLQKEWNLTLSFDGGSIRYPQTVETIHVTTASHQTFLVSGHEASGVSHTAKHIEEVLVENMREIGMYRFVAIVSDGAGNARKPRESIAEKYPWILSLYDAAHATSLPCKDICKLPSFESVIRDLRRILSYFKHSTFGTSLLTEGRKRKGIRHGLVSIGKTRFATIYYSGESLLQCLPVIRSLVKDGRIKIDKAKRVFENESYGLQFEYRLRMLVMLLAPFARAIKCFESSQLALSDVFVFWLAITASMKRILEDSADNLDTRTVEDIIEIVNYRYRNLIPSGNENPYVAAFYLDPRYRNTDILLKPNPLAPTIISLPATSRNVKVPVPSGNEFPMLFSTIGNYLAQLLQSEFKKPESSRNPFLHGMTEHQVSDGFKNQFRAYAQRHFPFDVPLGSNQSTLQWWKVLQDHPLAGILAFTAVKLFSIVPSSMADERTMSTFTWLNSPRRNRQLVSNIVDMTLIRENYREKDPQLQSKPKRQVITNFYELTDSDQKGSKNHDADSDSDDTEEDMTADPEGHIPWLDDEPEDRKSTKSLDRDDLDIDNEVNLDSVYLSGVISSNVTEAKKAKDELKGTFHHKPAVGERDDGIVDWFF